MNKFFVRLLHTSCAPLVSQQFLYAFTQSNKLGVQP